MPNSFKPSYRRLLDLDRRIRAKEYPNAPELADAWEVGVRTVMRDLSYLRDELSAPIAYDAGRRGFYYDAPNWFLPAVVVSEGELLGLILGRELLQAYAGTPVARDLESLLAKLTELLPEQIEIQPELLRARFSFCNPPSRAIKPAIWLTILRGLTRQQVTVIKYRSPTATDTKTHHIQPYQMLNLEGEWYVLALNERFDEVTQFAVGRIKSARLTGRRFTIPETFSVRKTLASRFGRYLHHDNSSRNINVWLRFEPTLAMWASEKEWHPEQRLQWRKSGHLDLRFPVRETRDVEPWILSLGEHVSVRAPKQLRERIKRRHAKAAGMHEE
jgi:predicted DNA-binding transcriptional regulator YafY